MRGGPDRGPHGPTDPSRRSATCPCSSPHSLGGPLCHRSKAGPVEAPEEAGFLRVLLAQVVELVLEGLEASFPLPDRPQVPQELDGGVVLPGLPGVDRCAHPLPCLSLPQRERGEMPLPGGRLGALVSGPGFRRTFGGELLPPLADPCRRLPQLTHTPGAIRVWLRTGVPPEPAQQLQPRVRVIAANQPGEQNVLVLQRQIGDPTAELRGGRFDGAERLACLRRDRQKITIDVKELGNTAATGSG